MKKLQITKEPVAKAQMLIRRPAAEVFNAFIDPAITTKFWFTKGSGKLVVGKKFTWTWEMYNVSTTVNVKEIEKNKRILIEWQGYTGPTRVEWVFTPLSEDTTFIKIMESGWQGEGDTLVDSALNSTGGFTSLLAGAKAWLEHGVELNLVADHSPKNRPE
jgi:uncharacterized protein YndB with AHSA1/START domain